MRRPPPITTFVRYPATAGTILLAVMASGWYWSQHPIDTLVMDPLIRRGELWRLLTSTLPHAGIFHLAFNAYWLWAFGTLVEEAYGSLKAVLLTLALACASSAAEYAFMQGGIGLSGIGYGYFGFLQRLTRKDSRFADAIDARTRSLFIVWFFICIILTWLGTMPVANLAHGVGWLAGWSIGWAVAVSGGRRIAIGLANAVVTIALIALAMFGRPYVNVARDGTPEARLGYFELISNHDAEALKWLTEATRIDPNSGNAWFNRGIAEQRLGMEKASAESYRRANELNAGSSPTEATPPETTYGPVKRTTK